MYLPQVSVACISTHFGFYSTLTIHSICKRVHQNWEDASGQPHLCFLCRNKLPAQSGLRCQPLLHLEGNPSSPSASASCPAHTHSVRNRTEREGWMMAYDRGRFSTDVRNFTRNCLRVQVCIYCPYWGKCEPTLPNYSCHIHVRRCQK